MAPPPTVASVSSVGSAAAAGPSVKPAGSVAEAILRGYFSQVRFLLELNSQADIREPMEGRTPLMLCALIRDQSWALSLARLLLEKGGRVGLKDRRRGMNALHYACACGRLQLTKLYLQAIDYHVNEADRQGNTPLHYAVRHGGQDIVQALTAVLLRFKLPLSPTNREGVTPMMLAYASDHVDAARRLAECGAADVADGAVDAAGKTAAAYEREALERLRVNRELAEARRSRRRLRFDDSVGGWGRVRRAAMERAASARAAAGTAGSTAAAATAAAMFCPGDSDLIRTASPLDKRCDPVEVFQASHPREFLLRLQSRQDRCEESGLEHSMNRQLSRSQSANALASAGSTDTFAPSRCVSAKRDIPRLFQNLEFHYSALYRPPPRPIDPLLYATDFFLRFQPPPASIGVGDGAGGGDGSSGDYGSGGGRRRRDTASSKKAKRISTATAGSAGTLGVGLAGGGGGNGGGGADTKRRPGRISRAAFNRDEP